MLYKIDLVMWFCIRIWNSTEMLAETDSAEQHLKNLDGFVVRSIFTLHSQLARTRDHWRSVTLRANKPYLAAMREHWSGISAIYGDPASL